MDVIEEERWIFGNAVQDTRWDNVSARYSSLPKSYREVASNFHLSVIKRILQNLQIVILGAKICVLFLAIPLAIMAKHFNFGEPWVFALSLLGLVPLAERVSFLTEQIAHYTGPTVGGLLNATCGNATELIIAILALYRNKIAVLKYSLLGSILSNLLLVLGSALLCGGLANLNKEQKFDKNQSDLSVLVLFLGVLCHLLPLMLVLQCSPLEPDVATISFTIQLSRVSSIVMLVTYAAFLIFHLKTHHQQTHQSQELENGEETCNNEDGGGGDGEMSMISVWSAISWLISLTLVVALLSEYVVGTIEAASSTWGLSVRFISIILLPIVGNAAEHAGAVIFAFRNKLDISLGVALGSATQISMFVVPLCAVIAWIIDVPMALDFGGLLETVSLAVSVIITALALQDGKSNYMKGTVLVFSYLIISACFFGHRSEQNQTNAVN